MQDLSFTLRILSADSVTGARIGKPCVVARVRSEDDAELLWDRNHREPSPNKAITRHWELLKNGKPIRTVIVRPDGMIDGRTVHGCRVILRTDAH